MKPLLIERSRELMRQDKMKKELANDIGEEEKVYTTLSGKIYDQQSDHEPESYKCEKCGKSFNSLSGKLCHTDCIKVELYTSSSDSYMKEYDCYEEQVYMDTDKPLNLSNSSLDDQSNVSSGFNSQSSLNSDGGQTTLTCDWLSELATIATEPKTVARSVSHDSDFASEVCHHSYAKPLDMSVRRRRFHSYSGKTKQEYLTHYRAIDIDEGLPSPPQPLRRHYSDENQLDSGYTSPMVTDKRLEDISHSKPITQTWPSAVWHCFIKGTLIRFANASEEFWHLAENLAEARREGNSSMIDDATFATSGLRVCHILDERPTEVCITFSADVVGQSPLEAMCDRDHPFIVKNKGWCSVEPHLTAVHYGIPCNRLEVHDITMSPSHPLAQRTLEMFESFKSLHFTSEDSSAVFALSNMAQKKKTIDLSPRSKSEVKRVSPAKKKQLKAEAERDPRCKRPMNAFMLYAKKHRVILMQKFPGRDNRSISVLLGDQWKKLPASEREIFAAESRLLAMEHKRINPDCWKRKRSYSTGSVV